MSQEPGDDARREGKRPFSRDARVSGRALSTKRWRKAGRSGAGLILGARRRAASFGEPRAAGEGAASQRAARGGSAGRGAAGGGAREIADTRSETRPRRAEGRQRTRGGMAGVLALLAGARAEIKIPKGTARNRGGNRGALLCAGLVYAAQRRTESATPPFPVGLCQRCLYSHRRGYYPHHSKKK